MKIIDCHTQPSLDLKKKENICYAEQLHVNKHMTTMKEIIRIKVFSFLLESNCYRLEMYT